MPDIVQQQLMTAWIQAAAALVQAIGAIAAIFFSVKIATDAERRAAAAEQASADRERQAEANAVAREEAADRAAQTRDHKAEIAPFNDAINILDAAVSLILEDIDRQIVEMKGNAGQRSYYVVSLNSDRSTILRNRLANTIATTSDVDYVRALEELRKALGSPDDRFSELPENVVIWLEDRRNKLAESIGAVTTFKLT